MDWKVKKKKGKTEDGTSRIFMLYYTEIMNDLNADMIGGNKAK